MGLGRWQQHGKGYVGPWIPGDCTWPLHTLPAQEMRQASKWSRSAGAQEVGQKAQASWQGRQHSSVPWGGARSMSPLTAPFSELLQHLGQKTQPGTVPGK